jgi:hypothetical protein
LKVGGAGRATGRKGAKGRNTKAFKRGYGRLNYKLPVIAAGSFYMGTK